MIPTTTMSHEETMMELDEIIVRLKQLSAADVVGVRAKHPGPSGTSANQIVRWYKEGIGEAVERLEMSKMYLSCVEPVGEKKVEVEVMSDKKGVTEFVVPDIMDFYRT